MQMLSKTMSSITVFQTENKLFKGEFMFGQENYRESLQEFGLVIGGY